MNKFKLGQKGFTIVELLIVIVIIGILATIGFVAFSGAQNKAKRSDAQSTLSQVKSKLGEFYVDESEYPADKDAVVEYLEDTNNNALATKFDGSTDYVYACATGGCSEGFTLTANSALWGGNPSANEVVTN